MCIYLHKNAIERHIRDLNGRNTFREKIGNFIERALILDKMVNFSQKSLFLLLYTNGYCTEQHAYMT